jgi:hypothetical protein
VRSRTIAWLAIAVLTLSAAMSTDGFAIDLYEIQIYSTETTPRGRLQLELHSNTTTTASGQLAKSNLGPYEIRETLEATYGITDHIELGQYLATAKLENGRYEYAGSRSKCHFGFGDPETWPVAVGGNVELDYMRRAAEDNPFSLELRPIVEKKYKRLWVVGDFAFVKPFNGPGTHQGFTLEPSGLIGYDLFDWVTPAIEYYADLGPVKSFNTVQEQQHFIFPTVNLYLAPPLELNFGVGFGLTRASNGTILKSIVGWTF